MGFADPPFWVRQLVGEPGKDWTSDRAGLEWRCIEHAGHACVSVRVLEAVALDAEAFHACTFAAYERVAHVLAGLTAAQPVRFWNYVPSILEPMGKHPHRYMVMNAARYDSYIKWYGDHTVFHDAVATASGVGHFGRDFHVHCLSAVDPGCAVRNPRQLASYDYSKRFGNRPPCFARATRITRLDAHAQWLLVGGTASVRGEESMFVGDLDRQLDETILNLEAVAAEGFGEACTNPLEAYADLLVYYTNPGDLPAIEARVKSAFVGTSSVEYLHCDLCRPELLVEIEGLAEFSDVGALTAHAESRAFPIPAQS